MDGYQLISLKEMLDTIGEERVKAILSNFSCPLNGDAPGDSIAGVGLVRKVSCGPRAALFLFSSPRRARRS